jgi:hypothetical protein
MCDMAVSLEDYRIQVIEQLKGASSAARVQDLLADVDLVLASAGLSSAAQRTFWESLDSDLDNLAEGSKGVLGKEAAAALSTVIAAARGALVKYRGSQSSDTAKSAD